jgi:hypothetical protein
MSQLHGRAKKACALWYFAHQSGTGYGYIESGGPLHQTPFAWNFGMLVLPRGRCVPLAGRRFRCVICRGADFSATGFEKILPYRMLPLSIWYPTF